MEQTQSPVQEQTVSPILENAQPRAAAPHSVSPAAAISPQACSSCGTAQAANGGMPVSPPCIYVIGHIEPRFPLLSLEKEARQAIARSGPSKENDREVMAKLLRDPANRYIVRRLCWVLSVQGVETYILVPRDGDIFALR